MIHLVYSNEGAMNCSRFCSPSDCVVLFCHPDQERFNCECVFASSVIESGLTPDSFILKLQSHNNKIKSWY